MKQLIVKYDKIIAKLDTDEYNCLEQNIIAEGCLDPIIINKDGVILDGHNRYAICLKNNIEFKTEELNPKDEVQWIYKHQLGRRNLTDTQRKILLGKIYNAEKKERGGDQKSKSHFGTLILDTAIKIAEEQKVSKNTVKRAGDYVNDIDEISKLDDKFEDLLRNSEIKVTANEAKQLANRVLVDKVQAQKIVDKVVAEKKSISAATREVVNSDLEKKELKQTEKKYNVIYADPPWEYDSTLPHKYGDIEKHYANMNIKDICDMPVKDITDDNCVLFLWVTSPKLPLAFDVIKAWGFEYKTSFVWDKIKHNVGYYNSVRHEFLLIAGKGKSTPTMDVKKLHDSVISIERSDIHSEKPEEFRKLIEELYPNTQKIELFARKKIDNWDNFGNQEI